MLRGRNVRLVDTAGLEESDPEAIYGRMRASSETAVNQADLIVFVVDARIGITPADEHFAQLVAAAESSGLAGCQQG